MHLMYSLPCRISTVFQETTTSDYKELMKAYPHQCYLFFKAAVLRSKNMPPEAYLTYIALGT